MENLVFKSDYGYIAYKIEGNSCNIELVYIQENMRHKGYGTKLMNDFIKNTPECNLFYLQAYSSYDMNSSSLEHIVNFYTSLGFTKDEKQWQNILNSNSLDDYLNSSIFMEKRV